MMNNSNLDPQSSINRTESEQQEIQNEREFWEQQEIDEAQARRDNQFMNRLFLADERDMMFI